MPFGALHVRRHLMGRWDLQPGRRQGVCEDPWVQGSVRAVSARSGRLPVANSAALTSVASRSMSEPDSSRTVIQPDAVGSLRALDLCSAGRSRSIMPWVRCTSASLPPWKWTISWVPAQKQCRAPQRARPRESAGQSARRAFACSTRFISSACPIPAQGHRAAAKGSRVRAGQLSQRAKPCPLFASTSSAVHGPGGQRAEAEISRKPRCRDVQRRARDG